MAHGLSDDFAAYADSGSHAFERVASLGEATLRFPLLWDAVQPGRSTWDWSAYDPLHQRIAERDLKAFPVILGCPEWLPAAQRRTATAEISYPIGSTALNAFGEFVVAVLERFTLRGDHIDAVEVWSEPNNPTAAHVADAAEFARMLATAALFVDSANKSGRFQTPKTLVSGGLRAEPDDDSWVGYLSSLTPQYFPCALGLHLFAQPDITASTAAAYGQEVARQVTETFGRAEDVSDADIWVTATGATAQSYWGADGQEEAVAAIASRLAGKATCRAVIFGPGRSRSPLAGHGSDESRVASPLLRQDWSPTPAFRRLEQLWAA